MSKSNRRSFWPKESSTFRRLWSSQHVSDLRWIFFGVLAVAAVASISAAYLKLHPTPGDTPTVLTQPVTPEPPSQAAKSGPSLKSGPSAQNLVDAGTLFLAIVAAGATVMSWAYQTGSKRLGVVDLFASEIATLCRVGTVVKFITNMTDQYDSIGSAPKKPVPSGHQVQTLRFNSKENYFTVFEHNSNDLEVLEADVVTNVTAFYTYMKIIRDMLRQLDDLRLATGPADEERKAVIDAIYMVFLAYESARRAIDDLIEYEPTHAEDTIVLLFTELPAFGFLRGIYAPDSKFSDKIRAQRLQLRFTEYQEFIPKLCDRVRKHAGEQKWEKANSMVDGLAGVFAAVEEEAMKAAADQPPPAAKAA